MVFDAWARQVSIKENAWMLSTTDQDNKGVDSLFIPIGAAGLSAISLVLHVFLSSATWRRYRHGNKDSLTTNTFAEAAIGRAIFTFMVIRWLTSLALVGLSVATLLQSSTGVIWDAEITVVATFVYASFLAFGALIFKKWSRVLTRHVNIIYFVIFSVYFARDAFPLMTFTLPALDTGQGNLLWAKLGLLAFLGVLLPLIVPRVYVPLDPQNPSTPSPEQTASVLSLATYTHLDPLIFLAFRLPHLPFKKLPALADYDEGHNLKNRMWKYLDTFAGAPKRHLFFGIMKSFRREYIILCIVVELHILATFASPIGLNRLLAYIETDGEDAFVRPWVWILFLLFGPIASSFSIQWYLNVVMQVVARGQAVLTQLVFEHSLRIRMKANASEDASRSTSVTAVNTPDTASLAEGQTSSQSEDSETLRASVNAEAIATKKDAARAKAKEDESENAPDTNLVGKINNLVSTDMENIVGAKDFFLILFYIPVYIVLCVGFLYVLLGWSAFVGAAFLLCMLPVPGLIGKWTHHVQEVRAKRGDARVQTITEIMGVLRMVKLFGWENKMAERLSDKREAELTWVKYRLLLELLNTVVNLIIPVLTMIITYATYRLTTPKTIVMKGTLTASIVFSSISVFDLLRQQLHEIMNFVTPALTGKVSLDRMTDFLHNTELIDSYTKEDAIYIYAPENADDADIGFQTANFVWARDVDEALTPSRRRFMLKIEDRLAFKKGGINIVVGPTGSGKTSLLMALLGEMHFIPAAPDAWYNLPRGGGIAYAAQESWVQSESIKTNILFGSPYDETRYKQVIYQCGLERDISLFAAGDETEVGEKGLTLSGGQKARITLARAIYSRAEILLLDDVLAALDVHTAKWIVDKCLAGDLVKGRTVILVTHNIALARPVADFVVSVKDGRINDQGTVTDVLGHDESLKAELSKEQKELERADAEIDGEPDPIAEGTGTEKKSGKLVVEEEIDEGRIGWSAMNLFFSSLGGGHTVLFFLAVLGGLGGSEAFNVAQTWWIGHWASKYEEADDPSTISVPFYLTVYSLCTLGTIVAYGFAVSTYVFGALRSARSIHRRLVDAIMGTTLRWLDTTPTSRVIARCTQDIRAVDGPVTTFFMYLLEITMTMLLKFIAIIVVTPLFVIPSIAVGAVGGACGQFYIKAQLSVKRELANAKSPVLAHFGAAIAGLTSVRAYGAQEAFLEESLRRINNYTRATRTFFDLNRWICIRVDALSGIFAASLAAYLVYYKREQASTTGFSLNMAIAFSSMIIWWVRLLNEFEVQGNSLERINNYTKIEQEPKNTTDGVPPAYWPASGNLHVEKLSARYSPDGPQVLHELSFDIKSGERVGIVGRTGSGKSSLTLALLRCIFTEGSVVLDGRPTSSVNLDALRTSITIIPQMPELLSGSLRENLDPFDQYDDAALNDALRAAGLSSLQDDTEEGRLTLDSPISSGGGNLSVGQRQILALARALVRGSKLLILDEATSAIDYKTDSIIQSSLRTELKDDVTLITVAHRLQTIMDSDKIMVLDAGRIVEFDSPANLLKEKDGYLRALVDESNDKATLYTMAEKK